MSYIKFFSINTLVFSSHLCFLKTQSQERLKWSPPHQTQKSTPFSFWRTFLSSFTPMDPLIFLESSSLPRFQTYGISLSPHPTMNILVILPGLIHHPRPTLRLLCCEYSSVKKTGSWDLTI